MLPNLDHRPARFYSPPPVPSGRALGRHRPLRLVARRLTLAVQYTGRDAWGDWTPLNGTGDTIDLYDAMRDLAGERHRRDLMAAMDRINAKCGVDTVYLVRMHGERGAAPPRIPFGKPPELGLADVDE